MTYQETLNYLYNAAPAFEKIGASAYKQGLATTQALDSHFGHPHRRFHSIHVAGTNGKGSVSHTIAAILQTAGYRVGLYTSPHLVDFAERIRVNGKPIDHEYVVRFVEQERAFFEPLSPSFFELTTVMAFKYFAEQEVDIAVIEVGLGGRLDSTNIISPLLSVITNISLDHTALLGDTLAEIAAEKAGIIKAGIPVVIGEATAETRPVFEAKAREMHAPIRFAQDCQYVISSRQTDTFGRTYATRCFGQLTGDLGGDYQEQNLNTVLNLLLPLVRAIKNAECRTAEQSQTFSPAPANSAFRIQNSALTKNGLTPMQCLRTALAHVGATTGLMGRWQVLPPQTIESGGETKGVPILCDTGHNPAAWLHLAPQLRHFAGARGLKPGQMAMVFGIVNDKDLDAILPLLPREAHYYFTQASTPRALPVHTLCQRAQAAGLTGEAYPTVSAALTAALRATSPEGFVFVGGSTYVVAEMMEGLSIGKNG